MDLLNLHQPWDCERFPKSKTICYGGGGGGGGDPVTNTVKKVTKTVSDNTPTVKVEPPPPIKVDPPKLPTLNEVKETVAKSDIGKTATKIKDEVGKGTEHLKKEGQKLKEGDYSLKKSIQGTASGASETLKKSDVGKTVKTIADKSGYTGSDLDKSMQKVESEGSNIANQTLDVVDQPGKYVSGKLEEFKQYAAERFGYADKDEKKTARPTSRPPTPGSDKTMGQGNIEGLKGGGSLAASERSRIRQNKRKLRIART